ncbi:hypothetical protein K438DRAFT_544922 [Mycena galopus ATCC 62051]|nr:hypothetical protein K438DRAFT_544922 [Mycena galopus ATCC 62051]
MADYAQYPSFNPQSHLAHQSTNAYAPQQQQQQQQQAGYALYRLGRVEPTTSSQQYPPPSNSNSHSPNNPTSNSSTTTNLSSNITMATSHSPIPTAIAPPTALLWTDLEPWMDAEYARQVCALMRWQAAVVVPAPPNSLNNINGTTRDGGSGANNAGYAVLTFASAAGASRALAQVNSSLGAQMTMPNSARAFVLGWAPPGVVAASANSSHSAPNISSNSTSSGAGINSAPAPNTTSSSVNANATAAREPASGNAYPSSNGSDGGMLSPGVLNGNGGSGFPGAAGVSVNGGVGGVGGNGMGSGGNVNGGVGVGANGYPKEYSIFVGDLAPETSNSDLVAVFRNPVLGLRNDRAPKFIRPFASCKSAKIMLDPVTGVSRGYGFVRFTDEADQQRALIEMHGLYCLSRPMRISPATAKFKPPQPDPLPTSTSAPSAYPAPHGYPSTVSLPTSVSDPQQGQQQQQQSVSAPIAVPTTTPTGAYYPGADAGRERGSQEYINNNGGGQEYNSGGMGRSASGVEVEYFAQQYGGAAPSQQMSQQQQQQQQQQVVGVSAQQQQPPTDEWRHTAQARAILGNLIGPNGEQLTSTDPYNTTVFVGGLSPLVGEDTLRTFFVPFGEIHYVKVPVGKHCGFVQFVRKADAERAIEKMQGFPVGGSRIRLSWGRSQYKAAQAAAQAAQAAALAQVQAQPPTPVVPGNAANANGGGGITPAMLEGMTHDQAVALLQKFGYPAFPSAPAAASAYASPNPYSVPAPPASNVNAGVNGGSYSVGGGYGGGGSGGSGGGNTSPEAYRSEFHSSSPSNSNVNDAYNSNANANGAVPHYTDESIKVRRGVGEEASFGYPARSAYEVPTLPSAGVTITGSNAFVGGSAGTSSFSPFSPDPNQLPQQQHQGQHHQQQHGAGGLYAAAEMLGKRRDSYAGQPYGQGLPHPSKAYAPGFFPVPPVLQTNGSASRSAGSGSGSPTRGGYGSGGGGGFTGRGSPPAFQVNRYQSHAQPISRPNSGSARRGGGEFGLDAMHDLNGTLASLDLDQREERGWGLLKSPTATEASVGGESSASGTSGSGSGSGASSGGSVQFRMSMESP